MYNTTFDLVLHDASPNKTRFHSPTCPQTAHFLVLFHKLHVSAIHKPVTQISPINITNTHIYRHTSRHCSLPYALIDTTRSGVSCCCCCLRRCSSFCKSARTANSRILRSYVAAAPGTAPCWTVNLHKMPMG